MLDYDSMIHECFHCSLFFWSVQTIVSCTGMVCFTKKGMGSDIIDSFFIISRGLLGINDEGRKVLGRNVFYKKKMSCLIVASVILCGTGFFLSDSVLHRVVEGAEDGCGKMDLWKDRTTMV